MDEAKCYACYDPASVPQLSKLALLSRIAGGFTLATFSSTTPATSFTTGSFTPLPNALVLAVIWTETPAFANNAPTSLSGNGLTWVTVTNFIIGTTRGLYVARSMGSNPSTGGLTFNFAGTQNGCYIRIYQFTNVNTSGTNGSGAVAQFGKGAATSTTVSMNTTPFAAFNANGQNTGIVFSLGSINPFGGTAKTGWTRDVDTGFLSTGVDVEYRLKTTDNAPTVTMPSQAWAAIGVEVVSS